MFGECVHSRSAGRNTLSLGITESTRVCETAVDFLTETLTFGDARCRGLAELCGYF